MNTQRLIRAAATLRRLAGDDYRMEHKSPGPQNGAPLSDLTANSVFPSDVYSTLREYGTGDTDMDRKAMALITKYRGKPNSKVKIYRAVPKSLKGAKINSGDWVTLVKEYAVRHSYDLEGPGEDGVVITAEVPASTLFTSGDSILEWGYHP